MSRSFWKRFAVVVCVGVFSAGVAYSHDGDHPRPVRANPAETYRPTAVPDRIVLSWTGDPTTSQSVTWRTDATVTHGLAQFALADGGPKFVETATEVVAETQHLKSDLSLAHYHTATFAGLDPSTKYVYRVGDGENWSEWSHFTTASAEPEPFSFVYLGDAQNDIKSHWSRVVREAFADAPRARFMLHAGDLVNKGIADAEWGEWFYASGWIHRTIPCVATPGNHEYHSSQEDVRVLTPHWRPTFAFPTNGLAGLEETNYYVDFQGMRLVSLNSNERIEDQTEWLDHLLAENPMRWTVVTFHHPVYSTGKDRDNPRLRAAWQPIFDKYRVDLVLQGHDHSYGRTGLVTGDQNEATGAGLQRPDSGTVYVVSVSGPKMYGLNPSTQNLMRRSAEETQLYQVISIDGDQLRYRAFTAVGELYDEFTLRKRDGRPNELVENIPPSPERRKE